MKRNVKILVGIEEDNMLFERRANFSNMVLMAKIIEQEAKLHNKN
jgi:hypothetical protein